VVEHGAEFQVHGLGGSRFVNEGDIRFDENADEHVEEQNGDQHEEGEEVREQGQVVVCSMLHVIPESGPTDESHQDVEPHLRRTACVEAMLLNSCDSKTI
jgi:hypothetical protein